MTTKEFYEEKHKNADVPYITKENVIWLLEQFDSFFENHKSSKILSTMQIKLKKTFENITKDADYIKNNQPNLACMFYVVLDAIGYKEESKKYNI